MFDLEREILSWKRAFVLRGEYAADQISELEAHLRDALDEEIREGASPQEAFDAGVRRVGSEASLRAAFLSDWSAQSLWVRSWTLFRGEARVFASTRVRALYLLLRLLSIAVGLMSLSAVYRMLGIAVSEFDFWVDGVAWYRQGHLFLILVSVVAVFNFTPFRVYTPVLERRLRKGYIWALATGMALWLAPLMYIRAPFWTLILETLTFLPVLIGPALWMALDRQARDIGQNRMEVAAR